MDLYQLRELFTHNGILMCFNGPFSHSLIEEIGIAIRNHLARENLSRMAVQDVFAVYIKMTLNVRAYLTAKNITANDAASATIVISRKGESYAVTSGNVILKEDTRRLQERIEYINTLPPDRLKAEIRQQLRREIPEGATGAGVGLMEMAKRASGKLIYSFRDLDERYDFFTLTAYL